MHDKRRRTTAAWTTMAVLAASAVVARADVKLASVFGDGMVVQRDKPVPVWGTAKPNAAVAVTLGTRKAATKADAKGQFHATVAAQPAGGPFTLTVGDGAGTTTLNDVYSGDVWLCSGQSNMQMSLGEADHGKATAADAPRHAKLRLCKIGQAWTDKPQTDCKATWTPATPESAAHFTAVGYFFGDALLESPEMADVPLGLIESDLGGTLAEAWTPQDELATIKGRAENSMFGIKPTTLYNGMIHPLGPVGLKGVIWYQGEGNAGDPASYPGKLTAMIRGWRKQMGPKLPFLIVQLPDYAPDWGGYYWQWMRDAQQQVAEKVPGVAVVNSLNTNDGLDLHPHPKQAIGRRAALLARQDVYGEKITGRGPAYKSADASGDGVRVTFDADGSKLAAVDPADVKGFTVAGDDGKFRKATARIDGDDAVVLHSDLVASPKFVRYAWSGVPESTLTNADGLPANAFRTDTLPPDMLGTQPQAGARVVGGKQCKITLMDGTITGFLVNDKQLLSNETGWNRGVVTNGGFGPGGFGTFSELGPDLVQLGTDKFYLRVAVEPDGCTWTVHNDDNGERELRINLSPVVKPGEPENGVVTLTRPGATVKVSGIDKVMDRDTLPFLDTKVAPHADATVKFTIEGH